MKKIIAIIPARAGSKGVPGKNIRLLAGYPLIAYTIVASQLCEEITRTIVSTDSLEIAAIAEKYGAEVPFIRPKELAGDNSLDIEFVMHAIDWFKQNEGNVPEYFVHLRPTTPLRDPAIIKLAIKAILDNSDATSLRSAHPATNSPFKWFLLNESKYFRAILPGHSNDYINQPRQSFPMVYIPDGYVDVLRTSYVKDFHALHGNKMLGFISPNCVEVDSPEDFEFLEFKLRRTNSPILDFLQENFTQDK